MHEEAVEERICEEFDEMEKEVEKEAVDRLVRLTISHDRDVLLIRPDFYDDERLDEMIRHGPGLVTPRLLHHSVVLGKLLQATFET